MKLFSYMRMQPDMKMNLGRHGKIPWAWPLPFIHQIDRERRVGMTAGCREVELTLAADHSISNHR